MQVFCLCELDELAPYADDWDRLAGGVPFRNWAWLSTWWKHYQRDHRRDHPGTQLMVPCVFDRSDRLIGLAPWYVDHRNPLGRVVRMLGTGEVCSDYLSVLCQPGQEYPVTRALCDCLTGSEHAEDYDRQPWDLLELTGCDAEDLAIGHLVRHFGERGHTVHRRSGPNCWRIELPASWEEYLAGLSKGHRKRLRRLERSVLDTDRAAFHTVEHVDDLPHAMDILVDLHQRRWRALGEPGCFASPRFAAFHREVAPKTLLGGQLQLHWLELDGKPAAAEYDLAGGGVVYSYQSGVDPEILDREPGRLMNLFTLRRAIEQGYRAFDFLRGDEPYKARYRAEPRPSVTVRVVPNRPAAQLRHHLWLAGTNVKHWIKSGLGLAKV